MNVSRRLLLLAGTAFGLAAAVPSRPALAWDGPLLDVVEGAEDFKIASDAYVFGYPLITMELTAG